MTNNYFLNGSNFRTGFTAGQIQIPGEVAPGVPVGLPNPYTIKNPKNAKVVRTTLPLDLTPNTQTFLPISSFDPTMGEIVPVDSLNSMYMLDFGRVVEVRLTDLSVPDTNVNIYFSYIDIYGKEGINLTTLNNVGSVENPIVACLGICSIYLTSDAPVTATLEFKVSNTFELPITDYGINSQLLSVSANNNDDFNGLWMRTAIGSDSEPYKYQWDGAYSNAQPTTQESTLEDANPRPWFRIQNNGAEFDATIENYTFTFLQNVYGLGSGTQFVNLELPQIDSSTTLPENIFGPKNYTKGFVTWKG